MKFGKRLAVEAARCWPEACLDYKSIKRALKNDLACGDASAAGFLQQLLHELQKVSAFYVAKAAELEAALDAMAPGHNSAHPPPAAGGSLPGLRSDIRQLIKFVALNYLAVVKAIKKRNRHVRAVCGAAATAAAPALHPMDLLSREVFFTSSRLAALSTRAELMAAAAADAGGAPGTAEPGGSAAVAAAVESEDYQCPICLDVLRSPVLLTCAHRFCWGCLVAHCAATTGPSTSRDTADAAVDDADAGGQQEQQQQALSALPPSPPLQQQHQHRKGDCDSGSFSSLSRDSSSFSSGKSGLVALEKLVSADAGGSSSSGGSCDTYSCPVCRQPQLLSIDNMTVDQGLARFVDELRARSAGSASSLVPSEVTARSPSTSSGSSADSSATLSRSSSALTVAATEPEEAAQFLLPRQLPQHAGRLTVLLDLDGTLITSFTPRRAPRLPPSMVTHLVGEGSSLNPAGVFVVERPGLSVFLKQLAGMAEVVVFTAGLEEYAAPIIDAIDPTRELISDRLYRPACTRSPHHQCVKDLALLGRPLSRTVLVDDTPLAFLHQPANGVPVLGFRGDPDDRLLNEAVLPLLQTLAGAPDVRAVLERRFEMANWFRRHGYPEKVWLTPQQPASSKPAPPACAVAPDVEVLVDDGCEDDGKAGRTCLVCDFDKTLTDWDAGERIVSELAPELLPWLTGLTQPANFVPATNEVLSEMARRGVSRDKLLTSLQLLGAEVPGPVVRMLTWAVAQHLPVKVLSDCNSVFIGHILAGARLGRAVRDGALEVVTNGATFERLMGDTGDAAPGLGAAAAAATAPASAAKAAGGAGYKLVVQPRHPASAAPHGCPLCPANLCKGAELRRLRTAAPLSAGGGWGRVVYAGDGANDICPALALGPRDVVLARAGEALARYAAEAPADPNARQLRAAVHVWHNHEQLARLVREHTSA